MSSLGVKLRTALALGPGSLMRVAWYRAGLRLGFNRVRRIAVAAPAGRMFHPPEFSTAGDAPCQVLPHAPVGAVAPDWHRSVYTGSTMRGVQREWWEIPDFDPEVGDIKGVWENSRFGWLVALAQHARCGDPAALDTLENWLADWCSHNAPYKGPNWKCGQEASIRVMHMATAALLLDQIEDCAPALLDLLETHLERIAPTISYAIAQNNNHGTSEAAALFIGGSWLERNGRNRGRKWASMGRRWLENRAVRLIEVDGTFSQYSVNYHRVMLDAYSMAEVWRRKLDLPIFSRKLLERLAAASYWLRSMVQPETGDAPNIGANDGARLIPLSRTDYRDFRPSVQLATRLFSDVRAYAESGSWDVPLQWLGIPSEAETTAVPLRAADIFEDGGFAVLRRDHAMVVVRYPKFRFRPSQADALHVDLWLSGENLLRDAGTYSYNTDDRWLRYFPGTESHNTVQFDGRDQMPRLGRFLFGDWLAAKSSGPARETPDGLFFEVGYRDRCGAAHRRKVLLGNGCLRVEDDISGFQDRALLRWRLAPGNWRLDGSSVSNGEHVLRISTSAQPVRIALVEGWESRYYMEKSAVPVLEVELDSSAVIISEYFWQQ